MFYTIVSVSLKMSAGPRLVTLGAGNSNTADIKTALKEDRKAGTFTDVVIACKDRETVSIHKLLLVATSKFLADILSNIDYYEEPPVLILPDFETTIIVRLVAAMYGDFDEELDWNWDLDWKWNLDWHLNLDFNWNWNWDCDWEMDWNWNWYWNYNLNWDWNLDWDWTLDWKWNLDKN